MIIFQLKNFIHLTKILFTSLKFLYFPEKIQRIEIKNQFEGTKKEMIAFNDAMNDEKYINTQTLRTQVGILCN